MHDTVDLSAMELRIQNKEWMQKTVLTRILLCCRQRNRVMVLPLGQMRVEWN